jgi:hypothetical protein
VVEAIAVAVLLAQELLEHRILVAAVAVVMVLVMVLVLLVALVA